VIRGGLRIVVALVILVLVASRVDLDAVWHALVAASARDVVIAVVASFATVLVISLRLRILLTAQGVRAGIGETFAINLVAFFYNLFVPIGGVGVAALRVQRLSRGTSGRLTIAVTAIVCDRLAAMAALGIVGIVCWVVDPHAKPAGGMLVLLGGLSTIALLVAPRIVPGRVRRVARRLSATRSGAWWATTLLRVRHAVGSVARLPSRALVEIIAISILSQLPGILVFVALGDGLGLSVPTLSMAWIRSVVVVLSLLPISIGGVGVREGALVVTLHAFGVPAHQAFALSILVFATTILAPGLVGGVLEGAQLLRPRAALPNGAVRPTQSSSTDH
jgi:uncharacterized protein (TIRG00374 family)